MTAAVDIEGLRFRYPGAVSDALNGMDLSVAEGETVAIVGANGSGKSTLARLLGGLEKAKSAVRASVCGHDLLGHDGRMAARRDAGVLFQNPDNQIVGANVEEDLAFGLENLGLPSGEIRTRVDEMLTRFSLADLRLRELHSLSGGQKQRTALAAVLTIPREVLVLDEPTAMLDPAGRNEVLDALAGLRAEGLSVVYITQEMDEVKLADRVVAIEAGRSVFSGTPQQLFADVTLLERLSLGLPLAGEVAFVLAKRDCVLPGMVLTVTELAEALIARDSATQRSLQGHL